MKFPNLPRKGQAVMETVIEIINYIRSARVIAINGVAGKTTSNGTTFTLPVPRVLKSDAKPPFWPNLFGSVADGYKLRMKKGWVCARHLKYGVDSVVTIEVTAIPGDPHPVDDALTVVTGDKVYCKITENPDGEATAAVIESGASWPSSTAPELVGGDDQTGANGTRYVRLCEIVTVDDVVKAKVLHTGHIDHFAPVLAENLTTSPGTGEARVLKGWNKTDGRYDMRYLVAGNGTSITEGNQTITVASTLTGLPSGTTGQILRYANDTWEATNVTEVTLSYCANGTPTSGTFLQL